MPWVYRKEHFERVFINGNPLVAPFNFRNRRTHLVSRVDLNWRLDVWWLCCLRLYGEMLCDVMWHFGRPTNRDRKEPLWVWQLKDWNCSAISLFIIKARRGLRSLPIRSFSPPHSSDRLIMMKFLTHVSSRLVYRDVRYCTRTSEKKKGRGKNKTKQIKSTKKNERRLQ